MIARHLIKNLAISHKSQLGFLPPCGPKMKKYPFFIKSQKCLKKSKFSTFSPSPGSRLIPNLSDFSSNSGLTLYLKLLYNKHVSTYFDDKNVHISKL